MPHTFTTAALRACTDPGLAPAGLPEPLAVVVGHLQSLALLAARLDVARVFFMSGLTKLHDWPATLALFADVYQVPLLPPTLAAYMATAGELLLPVLLVTGLATRFAAAGLFVVNLVAALSLAADDFSPAAEAQHLLWGVLALVLALWGAGRWSLDRLLPLRAAGR